ncbi:hypothetical protein [Pseudonocardia charpentierae]|uniref:Uncharacterized protein n=1 Tax=Pseudonocardia charpentierae TaxID=3075545 RepID=A0ABU2NIU2_9PSEU|nr:hypothetical protein [Pseudonocardia sp. DSM 45834]MDT0353144.1 hypothetical protein [Pseudonocardia sp. DSM 45834]
MARSGARAQPVAHSAAPPRRRPPAGRSAPDAVSSLQADAGNRAVDDHLQGVAPPAKPPISPAKPPTPPAKPSAPTPGATSAAPSNLRAFRVATDRVLDADELLFAFVKQCYHLTDDAEIARRIREGVWRWDVLPPPVTDADVARGYVRVFVDPARLPTIDVAPPPALGAAPSIEPATDAAPAEDVLATVLPRRPQSPLDPVRTAVKRELGTAEGVALEAANIVDTIAWAVEGIMEEPTPYGAARRAVPPAGAADAGPTSGWEGVDGTGPAVGDAAQPADAAPSPAYAPVTDAAARAVTGWADAIEQFLDTTVFVGMAPETGLLTDREIAQLETAIAVQLGLAFVGVEEVQLALRAVAVVGILKQVLPEIDRHPDDFSTRAEFWRGVAQGVVFLLGLNGASAARKIVTMVIDLGVHLWGTGAAVQKLRADYATVHGPNREAVLAHDLHEVLTLVAGAVIAAITHGHGLRGAKAPKAGAPQPAPETPAGPKPVTPEVPAAPKAVTSEVSTAPKAVTSEVSTAPKAVTSEVSTAPKAVTPEAPAAPKSVAPTASPAPKAPAAPSALQAAALEGPREPPTPKPVKPKPPKSPKPKSPKPPETGPTEPSTYESDALAAALTAELADVPEGTGPVTGQQLGSRDPGPLPKRPPPKAVDPETAQRSAEAEQRMATRRRQDAVTALADDPALQEAVRSSTPSTGGRSVLADLAADHPARLRELWADWRAKTAERASKGRPPGSFEEYVRLRMDSNDKPELGEYTDAFARGQREIMITAPSGANRSGIDLVAYDKVTDRIKLLDDKEYAAPVGEVPALQENLVKRNPGRKDPRSNLDRAVDDARRAAAVPGAPPEIGQVVVPRIEAARTAVDDHVAAWRAGHPDGDLADPALQAEIGTILAQHGVYRVVTTSLRQDPARITGGLRGQGFTTE